jgi:hypothetical protein
MHIVLGNEAVLNFFYTNTWFKTSSWIIITWVSTPFILWSIWFNGKWNSCDVFSCVYPSIPDIIQCKSTKKWSATIPNGHLFVINHLYEMCGVVTEIHNQMHNLYSLRPLFPCVKCGSRHSVLMHCTVLGYHIN